MVRVVLYRVVEPSRSNKPYYENFLRLLGWRTVELGDKLTSTAKCFEKLV